MATWRDKPTERPSYFMDIDNEKSLTIDKLANFKPSKYDTPEIREEKMKETDY